MHTPIDSPTLLQLRALHEEREMARRAKRHLGQKRKATQARRVKNAMAKDSRKQNRA